MKLGEHKLEDFLPVDEIAKAVSTSKLKKESIRGATLTKLKPRDCSQALELAASFMLTSGELIYLPEELGRIRGTIPFRAIMLAFLRSNTKLRISDDQVLFRLLNKKNMPVAALHLAELPHNRWLVADILLQNPALPLGHNPIYAKYAGLGNGIFDSILQLVEDHAISEGVRELCLMAAHAPLRIVFEKRGFQLIPGSKIPQIQLDLAEQEQAGFPMWKAL